MASNLVDIFAIAEEEEKLTNDSTVPISSFNTLLDKNFERTVVFVGEKSSGKSSIINLLKGGQKEEVPKPTYAMDYNFAKRTTNNRKEVVHLYEVGGGRQLSDLLGAPLTKESYRYIVYVIVVDLSKPSTIMDSISFWTNTIRDSVQLYSKFSSAGQGLP
jgi:GTPase SAR1 family protein